MAAVHRSANSVEMIAMADRATISETIVGVSSIRPL
jgi:hypothetical protein